MKISKRIAPFVILASLISISDTASAHFPWLSTDTKGRAVLWFGEGIDDTTYHMPDAIAATDVFSGKSKTKMKSVDTDELIGIRSEATVDPIRELHASAVYGNYHGTKLTYFVEHLPHENAKKWPTEPRADAVLQTVVLPPAGGKITIRVYHNGKPLPDQEVKLVHASQEDPATAKTNAAGEVPFATDKFSPGLNGLQVGLTEKKTGTHNGEPYESESYYLTSTLFYESKHAVEEKLKVTIDPNSQSKIGPSNLPDLPEELTSFGAAVLDHKLYVYGGHTGSAHSYSTAEQSNRFWSLDLNAKDKKAAWVKLPSGPRLQGLALVSADGKLVRLGGFTAMNAEGEEHDLHSQSAVQMYDPKTETWTSLPSLPEPRSSFDAVAIGSRVYIAGGWNMRGNQDTQWHKTAWTIDLSQDEPRWNPLSQPPFQARALSTAATSDKLYVIGGMTRKGPTTNVHVYDIASSTWSTGPKLPGSGMSGFGATSFTHNNRLYVSAMDGFVHELNDDGSAWRTITRQEPSRFFHRMLPIAKNKLVMIGGANMQIGKFTGLDVLELE